MQDWKSGHYAVSEERDVLRAQVEELQMAQAEEHRMRKDADRDLIKAMTALQEAEALKSKHEELVQVVQPIADMFEPQVEGVPPRPLASILQDIPMKLQEYVSGMVKSVAKQVLAFVKSFYPRADLSPIAEGMAGDCGEENFQQYLQDLEPIAEQVAARIELE